MHSPNRLFVVVVGLFLLLLTPGAHGAPLKQDRVDVFQLKSITKKRRHELTPIFSVSLNDNFVQLLNVGGTYTYHISEGIAFDLRFSYAFSMLTGLVGQMKEAGSNALLQPNQPKPGDPPNPCTRTECKFNPTINRPQIFAMGHFVWSPLIGKFAAGKSVVDFDIYLFAGGGYIYSVQPGGRVAHLAGASFGVGGRLLLTRWLTMRFEIQDVMYSQKLTGNEPVTGAPLEASVLTHNVFFSVGLGFMFPIQPVYTYEAEPR